MPIYDAASGYTHISIFEVRKDLAGFFKAINDGQRFAVAHYYTHLACVGPADSQLQPATPLPRRQQASNPELTDIDALLRVYYQAQSDRKDAGQA